MIIKTPCFYIYNVFKCHFKPNQKSQRGINDHVPAARVLSSSSGAAKEGNVVMRSGAIFVMNSFRQGLRIMDGRTWKLKYVVL